MRKTIVNFSLDLTITNHTGKLYFSINTKPIMTNTSIHVQSKSYTNIKLSPLHNLFNIFFNLSLSKIDFVDKLNSTENLHPTSFHLIIMDKMKNKKHSKLIYISTSKLKNVDSQTKLYRDLMYYFYL